jgi:curved DNA-binding protein CbpA
MGSVASRYVCPFSLPTGRSASENDIRRAYRKLAVRFHPDKNSDPTARDMFLKLSNAFEVLNDQDKRRKYDETGQIHTEDEERTMHTAYETFYSVVQGPDGNLYYYQQIRPVPHQRGAVVRLVVCRLNWTRSYTPSFEHCKFSLICVNVCV